MNSKREILLALIILFLFSFPLFIVFGDKGLADLNNLQQKRDDLIQYNKEITQNTEALKHIIKRLENEDPILIERIARDELNMIDKEEIVFMSKRSD